MKKYKLQDSNLTLREGIKELRQAEQATSTDMALTLDSEMAATMASHDATHVIFGCDTDMADEALAHFVMIFGSTVKISDLKKTARNKAHKEVIGTHNKFDIFKVLLGVIPDLVSVLRLSRNMKKKWLWFGFEPYLDMPLAKIREEFGIKTISRSP